MDLLDGQELLGLRVELLAPVHEPGLVLPGVGMGMSGDGASDGAGNRREERLASWTGMGGRGCSQLRSRADAWEMLG
jgi:hypothetical protein